MVLALLLYSARGICYWPLLEIRHWAGWTFVQAQYGHHYFCVTKSQISVTPLSTSLLWKPTLLQFTGYTFKIH